MVNEEPGAAYRLDAENPWPGLAWFGESAAGLFNGRTREVAELRRLVIDGPLTALFGRSGLGKTSLLKAGLFPSLRQAGYLPVYLRLDFSATASSGNRSLIEQLFTAFADACVAVHAEPPARESGESLWDYLHGAGFRVWSAQNLPLVPVFVLDQFEEVFTLGSQDPKGIVRLREDLADLAENRIPVLTEQRLAGDDPLAARLSLRRQSYRVLLSFREDFATAFERWDELPSLMRSRLQLLPMTGAQALDAVYKPATHLMDAETAERIVRFVASERPTGVAEAEEITTLDELSVEPALLSLVCRGLNETRKARRDAGGSNRIDRDLLATTGGGVVDRHYDACMHDQRERVHRFVESELVTESGFRKPCAQDDAMREPYGLALDSLRVLVDRRLLRIEPSLGVTRVELIHDLLTSTVVTRREARRRADQRRQMEEELREQEAARETAAAAARAMRRFRLVAALATAAVLAAVVVGALAIYARGQARLADAQRRVAEDQAKVARSRELAAAAITRLDLDPELAVRLAMIATDVSRTAQAESALRQALFRWPRQSRAPADAGDGGVPVLSMRPLMGHRDDVMAVAFSPDGTRLLSVSCDHTARIWDVASGAEVHVLESHRASLAVGAFSRDGRRIVTAGGSPCLTQEGRIEPNDTDVRIWDAATGRVTALLKGSPALLVGAAFSADGQQIVAGGVDGKVLSWTIATGEMRTMGDQGESLEVAGIQSIEFSPDGRQVATAGLDGSVVIWNAETGARMTTLRHAARVLALSFGGTTQDALLASVDEGGVAKIWDAQTFVERREIKSYSAPLYSTAFSRDGRFLVTAGNDLSIWETATGARMRVNAKHGRLFAASITPQGRLVAVGGAAGFLGILDCDVCVPLDELLELARRRAPRALTDQERRDFETADR